MAYKIQLKHHVSSSICILRIVSKIAIDALSSYRIMKFLGSASWWMINNKNTEVMKPHFKMQMLYSAEN